MYNWKVGDPAIIVGLQGPNKSLNGTPCEIIKIPSGVVYQNGFGFIFDCEIKTMVSGIDQSDLKAGPVSSAAVHFKNLRPLPDFPDEIEQIKELEIER